MKMYWVKFFWEVISSLCSSFCKTFVVSHSNILLHYSLPGVSQPFAPFETVKLGPPFDTSYVVEPDPNNTFHCMRHWSEIYGYCCGSPRCNANTSIHRMVRCLYIHLKYIFSLWVCRKIGYCKMLQDCFIFCLFFFWPSFTTVSIFWDTDKSCARDEAKMSSRK